MFTLLRSPPSTPSIIISGPVPPDKVDKPLSCICNAASDATVRGYVFAGTIRNWQVVIPDFGTIEGPFQITSLEFAGRQEAEVTFELALESAGLLSFTAI